MERCRFHVEQAAAAPLDVMFFSFRPELHPVLELLLAQAHRAGTSHRHLCPRILLQHAGACFPQGTFHCPKLTALSLCEHAAEYFYFPAQWPHLRILQMKTGISRLKDVANRTPRLEELALSLPQHLIKKEDATRLDPQQTFARLSALHTIYMTEPVESFQMSILQRIDCPSLRKFEADMGIEGWECLLEWFQDQHAETPRFSSPFTLTTLKLVRIVPGANEESPEGCFALILSVLKTLPALNSLRLGLTPDAEETNARPLLRALTMTPPTSNCHTTFAPS
ncbi:hypothetical protein BDV98DRAFT_590227 [Pterulicium gracile]|uniref:Uncharacterized protein n=1 Tax=Pterulicium gracile TaxID=1884261 RepID=A0A5C3QS95_9AGAR|nr:hypothetical protein BDV98DRAFT_590227 [Pterula gracilis]